MDLKSLPLRLIIADEHTTPKMALLLVSRCQWDEQWYASTVFTTSITGAHPRVLGVHEERKLRLLGLSAVNGR